MDFYGFIVIVIRPLIPLETTKLKWKCESHRNIKRRFVTATMQQLALNKSLKQSFAWDVAFACRAENVRKPTPFWSTYIKSQLARRFSSVPQAFGYHEGKKKILLAHKITGIKSNSLYFLKFLILSACVVVALAAEIPYPNPAGYTKADNHVRLFDSIIISFLIDFLTFNLIFV